MSGTGMQGTDAQYNKLNLTAKEDDESTTDGTDNNMTVDNTHESVPATRKRTRKEIDIGEIPEVDFHSSFPDFTPKDPLTASIPDDVIERARLELDKVLKAYMDDRLNLPAKQKALNKALAHIKDKTLPTDLGFKLSIFSQFPKSTDKELIAEHESECTEILRTFKTDLLRVRYLTLKKDYTATCDRLKSDYTREKYIDILRLRYADISSEINMEPFFLKCGTDFNTKFSLTEVEVRAQLSTRAERLAAQQTPAPAPNAAAASSNSSAPPPPTAPPAPPGLSTGTSTSTTASAAPMSEASLVSLIRQVLREEQKNAPSHSMRAQSNGRSEHRPSHHNQRSQYSDQRQQPLRDSHTPLRSDNRSPFRGNSYRPRSPPRGNSYQHSDGEYTSHRPFQSQSSNGGRGGTGRGYGRSNPKSSNN